jgi:hypothetical protein
MPQPALYQQAVEPSHPAARLQELRNSITVWSEVVACFEMLHPHTVEVLGRMQTNMADPWWFRLGPEALAQYDVAFRNLKEVASKYGGRAIRQALMSKLAWVSRPNWGGGVYQPPPHKSYAVADGYWGGPSPANVQQTFTQYQPSPPLLHHGVPGNPANGSHHQGQTQTLTRSPHFPVASKSDIRMQLDRLKSSGLPEEESWAMREKLKEQLRELEGS